MDPRDRADATLARARARGAFVVTPESATSPMDVTNTVQIPRVLVDSLDSREDDLDDPDRTIVVRMPVQPGDQYGTQPYGDDQHLPAIAQEALTRSVAAPNRPTPYPRQPPADQTGVLRPVDGLVPTEAETDVRRSRVSDRLDG